MKSIRYLLTLAIVALLIPTVAQAAPQKKKAVKNPPKSTQTSSTNTTVMSMSLNRYSGDVITFAMPLPSGSLSLETSTSKISFLQFSPVQWIAPPPPAVSVGNVNGDGSYSVADLQALLQYLKLNNGSSTPVSETSSRNDINSDSVVNTADLQALLVELKPGAGSSTSAVPEPPAFLLSAAALACLAAGRRFRRR